MPIQKNGNKYVKIIWDNSTPCRSLLANFLRGNLTSLFQYSSHKIVGDEVEDQGIEEIMTIITRLPWPRFPDY